MLNNFIEHHLYQPWNLVAINTENSIFDLKCYSISSAELNEKKLNLIAWINQLSDINLITFLEGIRKSSAKDDWWDERTTEQRKTIDEGLKDIENGDVISSTEFWKMFRNA